MIPPMDYDPLYVQFIYYFNEQRDYFECHEVLEELWLEEGRNPIYQGLLQVAVGLYHFRNENISGAIKLFQGAVEKLKGTGHIVLGIHMDLIVSEVEAYVGKLQNYDASPLAFYDLTIKIADNELEQLVQQCVKHPPSQQ